MSSVYRIDSRIQGAALALAPPVLNVAIAIRSSGLDDIYLSWRFFA